MTAYIRMTDNFMSGWGQAQGLTNVLVVACDTLEQADLIEKNANLRPEMKRVQYCINKPRERDGYLMSYRHYDDLGKAWKRA